MIQLRWSSWFAKIYRSFSIFVKLYHFTHAPNKRQSIQAKSPHRTRAQRAQNDAILLLLPSAIHTGIYDEEWSNGDVDGLDDDGFGHGHGVSTDEVVDARKHRCQSVESLRELFADTPTFRCRTLHDMSQKRRGLSIEIRGCLDEGVDDPCELVLDRGQASCDQLLGI